MHLVLPVLLALASAFAFALSTVGQQRAAARSSDEDARRRQFVVQLLRNPGWVAATLGNTVGFGLQAAALGTGSVVLVQPILVTSLLFALPLSARLARQRLPANAMAAGLILSMSLSVFVTLADAHHGLDRGSLHGWLIVTVVGFPLVACCMIVAHPCAGAVRASLLAIGVGLLGGVLAVLTKSVVGAGAGGVIGLLSAGETYGLIVVGLAGVYLQQLSFQAGGLQASLPIMMVLEPVSAAMLGVTLLHEQISASAPRLAGLAAAALLMAAATIVLAHKQGSAATARGLR